jgi:hypothetical protein
MPVRVEIVTYAPTVFTHCQQCEVTFREAGLGKHALREQAQDSLPPELLAEFQSVSDWVHGLVHRYGDEVRFRLVDAVSIEGVFKSFLHRARRYPSIVVDGETFEDLAEAEVAIAAKVAA